MFIKILKFKTGSLNISYYEFIDLRDILKFETKTTSEFEDIRTSNMRWSIKCTLCQLSNCL